MAVLVIDSSVIIARLFNESASAAASAFLTETPAHNYLHAPNLLRYELASVVRKSVHRKRLTPNEGKAVLEEAFRYSITLHFDDGLLLRAYELAEKFAQPSAYDAQYLALAERLACEFWTADERLFNSVRSQFPSIRWLGAEPIHGL